MVAYFALWLHGGFAGHSSKIELTSLSAYSSQGEMSMEDRPMRVQVFAAVIHREDDIYIAECPEVGTVSQGHTIDEAIANLKEATELYLEEFPLPETTHPIITTFEAKCAA